jgi:hypothetical protein
MLGCGTGIPFDFAQGKLVRIWAEHLGLGPFRPYNSLCFQAESNCYLSFVKDINDYDLKQSPALSFELWKLTFSILPLETKSHKCHTYKKGVNF